VVTLIVAFVIWVFSALLGLKVLRAGFRRRPASPVPSATITNADGAERVYQSTVDLANRGSRAFHVMFHVAVGLLLFAWPIVLAWVVLVSNDV
jgi:hypothetical protein